jgi:hypothetical protein
VNRRSRGIALLVALATLAVAASACGGSSSDPEVAQLPAQSDAAPPSTATTLSGSKDPRDVLVDFTRCLRDQGIDVPDPDFEAAPGAMRERLREAGIDVDDPRVQAAIRTCQPLLLGILQTLTPEQVQAFRDAMVDYAACMREQGVDLPDPDFSQGFQIFDGAVDPSDPAFQAANEECAKIFQGLGDPFGES